MSHEPQHFSVGQHVRFKSLPENVKPTPIRITGVTIRGNLYLENHAGIFAPWLFELVDPPPPERRWTDFCNSCGHVHEAPEECGMFMGKVAGYCPCQAKVLA